MELGSWFHFLVWDERWERRHRVFGEKSWVSCAVENGEVWRREQALPIQEAPGSERCSPCPTQGFSQRQMSHRGWRWSPSRLKWQRGDHLPSSSLLLQVCFLLVSRFPFILTLLPPLPMASKASTSGFFPLSIPESLSILLTQDMWFFFPWWKHLAWFYLLKWFHFCQHRMRSTPHQKPKVSVTVPGHRFTLLFYPMGPPNLGKLSIKYTPWVSSLLSQMTDLSPFSLHCEHASCGILPSFSRSPHHTYPQDTLP